MEPHRSPNSCDGTFTLWKEPKDNTIRFNGPKYTLFVIGLNIPDNFQLPEEWPETVNLVGKLTSLSHCLHMYHVALKGSQISFAYGQTIQHESKSTVIVNGPSIIIKSLKSTRCPVFPSSTTWARAYLARKASVYAPSLQQ